MNTHSNIPAELAGAILSIDLGALQANYLALAKQAGKAEAGAAVKGNAYGLGLEPVVKALWAVGCRTYFVARPKEGEDVRQLLPDATIYVLDGLFPNQAEYYARHNLCPALISVEEAREWAAFGRQYGRALPCALHVDTGINRLGLSEQNFNDIVADQFLFEGLNVTLLMSHLACADDVASSMNDAQAKRFLKFHKALPNAAVSLSNSSGIFLGHAFAKELVRPGIALYGGNPTPHLPNPMKAVVTLQGTVLQVRDIKKGETVGYSATWTAQRDSRIAILGAGYKDGVPRHLSSRQNDGPAQVMIAGQRCPIVGRVSMDMMGIDVTDVLKPNVMRGSHAEIIGPNISIDEVASWAGTISYEILTRLGSRYARVYSGVST
jgi:alanine racemase